MQELREQLNQAHIRAYAWIIAEKQILRERRELLKSNQVMSDHINKIRSMIESIRELEEVLDQ